MAATYSSLVGLALGGKYEIRRVLGIGGMGVVCEAIHLELGRKVAIKIIDKTMKESELIVARFRREARALGQVQSEHIVDVFDVGADPRVGLYMVMEHLTGEDLQSRLEREERVDVATGVMIGQQIARALQKAHAAAIIHRDLKPANVFLTKRDNGSLLVKLLDFGVSKLTSDPGGARITGTGAPIGTPLYMSPEQAEGRDDTDGRADIWSLGAVLYEAFTGRPAFSDRGSYHATIVGILTTKPAPLHDVAKSVPAEIARVVDDMLVHDRDNRIPDAATVAQRLLEAFPTVLPDGTGRHTAVIVTNTSLDATGDTEVFTATDVAPLRPSDPGKRRDSAPANDRVSGVRGGGTNEAVKTATPNEDAEDSARTLPTFSTGKRAAAPDPRERDDDAPHASRPGATQRRDPGDYPIAPSSAGGGVAMPATPPYLPPLRGDGDRIPDTMRDDALALRAERRRRLTLTAVAALVLCIAGASFLAGRHTPREADDGVATDETPASAALQASSERESKTNGEAHAVAPAMTAPPAAPAIPAVSATPATSAATLEVLPPSERVTDTSERIPTITPDALPTAREPGRKRRRVRNPATEGTTEAPTSDAPVADAPSAKEPELAPEGTPF